MAAYYSTNKAVANLTNIWEYSFENWSEKQAEKYYHDQVKVCARISKHPNLGKKYSITYTGLKGFQINHHIIFFRETNSEKIDITRILHEQMDLRNGLLE